MRSTISHRRLSFADLARVREIDRTEPIDTLYVQRGARLELRHGNFSAPAWSVEGTGEHSLAAQQAEVEKYVQEGAVAFGAFEGERLVGIGVVLPHIRPHVAQLAYLHVSNGYRARGVGARLADELEEVAREAGDRSIVVSATPSRNTVRFYERRGFRPMVEPLPELYELEPEDVHMVKGL